MLSVLGKSEDRNDTMFCCPNSISNPAKNSSTPKTTKKPFDIAERFILFLSPKQNSSATVQPTMTPDINRLYPIDHAEKPHQKGLIILVFAAFFPARTATKAVPPSNNESVTTGENSGTTLKGVAMTLSSAKPTAPVGP